MINYKNIYNKKSSLNLLTFSIKRNCSNKQLHESLKSASDLFVINKRMSQNDLQRSQDLTFLNYPKLSILAGLKTRSV